MSIHILLILLGCPAEQLGIELPPGGAAAISQEDLRRDTLLLGKEGEVGFARRMRQMHAEMDGRCAVREGRGAPRVLVATDDLGRAALISLAKAADTDAAPPALRLCLEGEGTAVTLSGKRTADGDYDWVAAAADTRRVYQEIPQ